MKRFLALLLALALILSPATAFADETTETTEQPPHVNARIPKNLVVGEDRNPAEDFVFEFTNPSPDTAPAIPNVTISYAIGESGLKHGDINLVNFDDAAVGRYEYQVSEDKGNTAGMTYSEQVGTLIVDKESDGTVKSYLIIGTVGGEPEEKFGDFTNTFTAWDLDVTKKVTGNLGDTTKEFTLTVTLKAPEDKTVKADSITLLKNGVATGTEVNFVNGVATLTLTVKHNDKYTIADLPHGVTYAVVEEVGEDGKVDEYTVAYENASGTMNADKAVTVTNHKSSEVPTGITLDNMPYIILMAVALVGLGAFALRKRAQN